MVLAILQDTLPQLARCSNMKTKNIQPKLHLKCGGGIMIRENISDVGMTMSVTKRRENKP